MSIRDNLDISAYLVLGPENTLGRPVGDVVAQALDAGFTCIQVRSKVASAREIIALTGDAAQAIAQAGKNGQVKPAIAIVATFLTTFVSGVIFMIIKMAMLGVVGELAAAMLPVVAMTAVFNAILVGALYLPIQKALRLN